jgi:3-hydroxyisobutyrate dehydrogenase
MLASGPRDLFESVRAELERMTGRLTYLGVEPDRAAAFKLLGNLFLIEMMVGVSDVFALAKSAGVPAEDAATLFDVFNPAALIGPRAKRMLDAKFHETSFSLEMARKDVRLMLESAERGGARLTSLPGIAAQMDLFLSRGHAKDDWTVIAKDAVAKKE